MSKVVPLAISMPTALAFDPSIMYWVLASFGSEKSVEPYMLLTVVSSSVGISTVTLPLAAFV